jgi:hypothetical protein
MTSIVSHVLSLKPSSAASRCSLSLLRISLTSSIMEVRLDKIESTDDLPRMSKVQ